MIGILKRKLQLTNYQLKIRKEVQQLDRELLQITYEETKKEIERRNKQ